MDEIGVCRRSWRHAIIEGIALACDGRGAVATHSGEESGLSERQLGIGLGRSRGHPISFLAPLATVVISCVGAIVAGGVYSKEVLNFCWEMARIVGMFPGR